MKLEQYYNNYIDILTKKTKEYLNKILDLPITNSDFDNKLDTLNTAMYRLYGFKDFMESEQFKNYNDVTVLEHFYQLLQLCIDSCENIPSNVINKLDSIESIISNNFESK